MIIRKCTTLSLKILYNFFNFQAMMRYNLRMPHHQTFTIFQVLTNEKDLAVKFKCQNGQKKYRYQYELVANFKGQKLYYFYQNETTSLSIYLFDVTFFPSNITPNFPTL